MCQHWDSLLRPIRRGILIKDMILKYGEAAKQSGSKIVNCCGFDSIPSDLGVFELQKYSKEQFGSYAHQIKLGVEKTKGGVSGRDSSKYDTSGHRCETRSTTTQGNE